MDTKLGQSLRSPGSQEVAVGFFLVCGGGGAGLGEAERCLRQSCSALETAFALGMGDMD